jgi:hypothetical protein
MMSWALDALGRQRASEQRSSRRIGPVSAVGSDEEPKPVLHDIGIAKQPARDGTTWDVWRCSDLVVGLSEYPARRPESSTLLSIPS